MIISAYLGVAGLVDTGYRFYTTTETAVAARVTAGIVDAGNGWYSADGVTIPGTAASVRWDSTGTSTAIAREYFDASEAASFASIDTKLNTIDDFLDTEIAAILTKVNALPTDPADASDIAASFATLNTKVDTIDDFLDTEVAAIKAKTDNLPVDPADASDIAASFVTVNGTLSTISGYIDTEVAAIKAVTDKLNTALVIDGAVYQYTANALELAPVGGGGGGDASQATLLAVKAKTDALPTDPADASDIAASFATVNSTLATLSGYVDTEVAAIKSKTDNLPVDPADASDIAANFATLSGKVDVIDDFLDTEIAAIKAKTDQLIFTGGKVDANATTTITPTDLNAIADALLKRDWNSVSGEAAYSALNAFRMLRNVWSASTGTLIVKKEDGTTTAWSRALTTDPAAQPITGAT